MSVPVGKRGQGKLEVLTKALALCDYTIEVTKNEKLFPKRDRWILTNRIVNETLDLATCIRKGNSIRVEIESDFLRRREYQQTAFEHAEMLLTLLDIAYRNLHLEGKRVEYWTGLIFEIETLISAWRKSDRDAWRKRVNAPKGD